MKNYYVMDANHRMWFRGTLETCKEWVEKTALEWCYFGYDCPKYRVFYDGTKDPCWSN